MKHFLLFALTNAFLFAACAQTTTAINLPKSATIDGSIGILEENVTTLEDKTIYQNTNAASQYTRFTSDVRINNGVSDRILLKTSGTSEFADNVLIDGSLTTNGINNSGTIKTNNIDFISTLSPQTMNIGTGGGLTNIINIGYGITDVINLNGIVVMPYNLSGFMNQW